MKLVSLREPSAPDSTLIYDWNAAGRAQPEPLTVTLLDETLRDGLQSPSVRSPSLTEKLAGLELMNELGIEYVNVGLPSASPRALSEAIELCRAIVARRYAIRPVCAGRTMVADVAAIAEVSQRAGLAVEASLFVGSSPIRAVAEDWDLEFLLSRSKSAIDAARHADLPVTFVTEDTTRARPETLRALFSLAVERGAARICLCDTVGFATPEGAAAVTLFSREIVGARIGIDWHGHNDRGLAVANALSAARSGADRLHATALGVGERVGNPAMELLLLNLLLSNAPRALERVSAYCEHFARVLGIGVSDNQPLVGKNAFRTATGVHASAIAKAEAKSQWLADHVYSLLSAASIGQQASICIGPMSGSSNVQHWLSSHGISESEPLLRAILERAKSADHVLTDEELLSVVSRVRREM
ncbi:MAG TPA: 2-isopropylmalate synthase [Polyangiaceae bacterium]|nr:2-isopropylmalate synthase [Polyangiaceae bacterium]